MRARNCKGRARSALLIAGIAAALAAASDAGLAAPRKAARNAPAPPLVSDADRAALAGPWSGTWTGNRFSYQAVMTLAVDQTGNAAGSINWTLRASPNERASQLVGKSGVENIRGTYYPDSATLSLQGYSKADPSGIVELDQYLLVVSPTRQTMGGITGEHGAWTGQLYLSR
jgi:hypothetical protein